MSYPNKEQRTKCYTARDDLWKCLDDNGDNAGSGAGKCSQFRKLFETQCPPQWVTHFDRKRDYLKYKDKIENDGYEPIDEKSQQQRQQK
ncbi:cytochrome c oxidase assembly factor 6 homolog [Oppia nitens]|uniref:cytochrome c oxidase assembly factor 6 homolog n=1 Tax=Oppia nitens TaxID=1686743 RepID=UPI0023D9C198|nr:cytochrome c oxidase assembly factor 6 homolog [Oppia nitens]